jgi:predicted O-methyltransferase YrrM
LSLLDRIPLTLPHAYDFGADRALVGEDLVNPTSWDSIRETVGPFGLPAAQDEWERAAARPELVERARMIAQLAERVSARRLCSYGVGTGALELCISRAAPQLDLVCTDFAPRTVERLRVFFPEATVLCRDLSVDGPVAGDLHLLHRIDSEFSNRELRAIIERLEGVALVVATELLGPGGLVRELVTRLRGRRTVARAGFVRTEAAFRRIWRTTHDDERLELAGLNGFVLTRRPGQGRDPLTGTGTLA